MVCLIGTTSEEGAAAREAVRSTQRGQHDGGRDAKGLKTLAGVCVSTDAYYQVVGPLVCEIRAIVKRAGT